MTKRSFLGIVFAALPLNAQDLNHYKQIVKELSSSKYQGRGYVKGGANKAGKYLASFWKMRKEMRSNTNIPFATLTREAFWNVYRPGQLI